MLSSPQFSTQFRFKCSSPSAFIYTEVADPNLPLLLVPLSGVLFTKLLFLNDFADAVPLRPFAVFYIPVGPRPFVQHHSSLSHIHTDVIIALEPYSKPPTHWPTLRIHYFVFCSSSSFPPFTSPSADLPYLVYFTVLSLSAPSNCCILLIDTLIIIVEKL